MEPEQAQQRQVYCCRSENIRARRNPVDRLGVEWMNGKDRSCNKGQPFFLEQQVA